MKNLLGILVLCALAALAQINTALLDGTVTDPTGAAVPAAEVTILNVATGQQIKTATNEKGQFAVPSMPAATYKVTLPKSGFRMASIEGVVLNAGVPASVNVQLEIGQANEVIQVSAGTDVVQTSS